MASNLEEFGNGEPEAPTIDQRQLETMVDVGHMDDPSIIGPPSPLTGCYLLIILAEPHSPEHKDIMLQRLLKGNWLRHSQRKSNEKMVK